MEKGKKKIKRKKGKRKPYFGQEVHNSIVKFQELEDPDEKEQVFILKIRPAFEKLTENLIFIYGHMKNHDSYEELKADCVSHLYEKIDKFDNSRGFKAFSYFNIVARNFLTMDSRDRLKSLKIHVGLDDHESMTNSEIESFNEFCTLDSMDELVIKGNFNRDIIILLNQIKKVVKKENEKKTMEAIIYLFKNIDNADYEMKKRAIFKYLREITLLESKQLTTTIASIKKHFRAMKDNKDYGIIKG